MRTIALLTISNIFMTFAWYGHLKYRDVPLLKVIVISWGIAFFEYCFQVPANRIGSYEFTAAQLKTIQEVITLTVFAVFIRALPETVHALELRSRLCPDRRGGGGNLQEMVKIKSKPVVIVRGTLLFREGPRRAARRGASLAPQSSRIGFAALAGLDRF
jgi:uncharacterized protein (DUF486 family)